MSAGHKPGWFRFGAPAAVSVVLGVMAGISVSGATTTRAGVSSVIGAVAAVASWALWEAWRAVKDSREESVPGDSVTQTAWRIRGRLTGWTGPLAGQRPVRTTQKIGTVEPGGTVTGVDIRSDADPPPPG